MKSRYFLISTFLLGMLTLASVAQTDLTHKIINPSFEENIDAMATGWTYEGGSDAYAWHVINTDGDATKDGNNICGLWNPKFGDVAITQTITGLENGVYVVTAGVMVGVNGATPGQRLTTQRIFANNNSVLYGAEADYSAENISVLTSTLGETISYAGYGVSTAENGPFAVCTVETKVTDGTLVFGIKTNGTDSQYNFSFPGADESGWGWFKIDNFTLSLKEGATGIKPSTKKDIAVRVNNGYVLVEGAACYKIHDLNGREIKNNVQLERGIYVVSTDYQTVKVAVK